MDKDTRKLVIIATHLSQFFAAGLFPLIVFLVSDDKAVKEHAREALNWFISLFLYSLVCIVLFITIIGIPFAIIGFVIIGIIGFIFPIIGAVKASEGTLFQYPFTIRFV